MTASSKMTHFTVQVTITFWALASHCAGGNRLPNVTQFSQCNSTRALSPVVGVCVSADLFDRAASVAVRRSSINLRRDGSPAVCVRTGAILRRLARLVLGEMAAGRVVRRSRKRRGTDCSAGRPTGGDADRRHRTRPFYGWTAVTLVTSNSIKSFLNRTRQES